MICVENGQLKEVSEIDKSWYGVNNFYEVIRVVEGKPLFLEAHFQRLASGIGSFDIEGVKRSIMLLIRSIDSKISQNIYMSIHKENKAYILFFNPSFYPPKEWYQKGIWVPLISIEREDPNSKVFREDYKTYVKNYLAERDAYEGLLISDGDIKEGSRSNVFFIREGKIFTPPTKAVLPGITRRMVYESCQDLGIEIVEMPILVDDLATYEGAFVTGTSIDLLPLSGVEAIKFDTVNSTLYKTLSLEYNRLKTKDLSLFA